MVTVRARLDLVVSERDALARAVETAKEDMLALESVVGEDERQIQSLHDELSQAAQVAALHDQKVVDLNAGSDQSIRLVKDEMANLAAQVAAFSQQYVIEKRNHSLTKATLQATIATLTDRLSDLKSMMRMQPMVELEEELGSDESLARVNKLESVATKHSNLGRKKD